MSRPNTPPNWKAPFEAYEAKYKAETKPMAAVLLGIQDRGGDVQTAWRGLEALLTGEDAPQIVEHGWHRDTPGAHTQLVHIHWRDADSFARWRSSDAVNGWLMDKGDALIGKWIESTEVHPRALDTLVARTDVHWGVAQVADSIEVTPYHAYWGGTRDRILISENDPLENADGPSLPQPADPPKGIGEVVDVVLPAGAVSTRGGPDWSCCDEDERLEFRNSVYPAYQTGCRYLRDNAADAGCYAAYLVQSTDARGAPVERDFQIAYFVQLSDLERWTKDHPTHKDIYGRFMRLLAKIKRMPDVNLYHEVSVMPQDGVLATYVNCLPSTSLLRFGQVRGA